MGARFNHQQGLVVDLLVIDRSESRRSIGSKYRKVIQNEQETARQDRQRMDCQICTIKDQHILLSLHNKKNIHLFIHSNNKIIFSFISCCSILFLLFFFFLVKKKKKKKKKKS